MFLEMKKNNQGKTDKQIQDSEFILAVALVGLISCVLLALASQISL